MTRQKLVEIIAENTSTLIKGQNILSAVDAYTEASNGAKPIVSGALPPESDAEILTEVRESIEYTYDMDTIMEKLKRDFIVSRRQ